MADAKNQDNEDYTTIDMDQLLKLMKESANDLIIIDQRSNHKGGDFHGGHILNAINIPCHEFESQIADIYFKYNTKKYIIIHCMHSQVRGPQSAQSYVKYLNQYQPKSTQSVCLLQGGFAGFINKCIKNKTMEFVQDYDASKWEFVDGEYYHIIEERLLTKQILEKATKAKKEADEEEDEETEEEQEEDQ